MRFIPILIIIINTLSGQDSLRISFSSEIKGKHIVLSEGAQVLNERFSGQVTDNPFNHFAIYGGAIVETSYLDKYKVELGLFMEERSYSAGNNTVDQLAFFPKIKLSVTDTFRVFKKDFKHKAMAGAFWNEDFDDIMRIHNLDFQALQASLGLGKYWLSVYAIGDLSFNTGLGLHELYKIAIQHEGDKFYKSLAFSINQLDELPNGSQTDGVDYNIDFYIRKKLASNWDIQTQLSTRFNPTNDVSYAIGAKATKTHNNTQWSFAARYYTYEFNLGYINWQKVSYRDPSRNAFVGNQLYPLKNYFRTQNQWALFTSYQNESILSAEVVFEKDWTINKTFNPYADIDINLLYLSNRNEVLLFPIYDLGFKLSYHENFSVDIGVTNKHMNLDFFYQGFYISEKPFFTVTVNVLTTKSQIN